MAVWLQVRGRGLSLRPIGSKHALSVAQKAPLQLQYASILCLSLFYILNNSAKSEPVLIILVYRILGRFHIIKL